MPTSSAAKTKVNFIFIFILFYLMLDKQKETRGVQSVFQIIAQSFFSLPSRKNKLQKKKTPDLLICCHILN